VAIDNIPAVQDILEQENFLEQMFKKPLMAVLAYSRMADRYTFPNGIGETITKTRPALYPLSAAINPLNPSNNTGIDNGLSDTYWVSEQYQIAINEYALSTTTNIKQDRTLIQRTFLQNVVSLGENAGRTFDALCSQFTHQAYDSGNTFCLAAATGTTVHVDNMLGFNTAFSATNSPGLPTAVSVSNTLTVYVYDVTTHVLKDTLTVTGATADVTNISTAYVGGIAYGVSGVLTVTSISSALAAGDHLVAVDGCFVQRCGGANSRYDLAAGDIITLEDLAQAGAKLRARGIPELPTGGYACIIDPRLWPLLLKDTAFNYATMGQMGEGYFATGMVNRTLGLEFVNSNMVPAFATETAGVQALHAVVCGAGMLIKGTFQGHIDASKDAMDMEGADIRFIDEEDISLITRKPLDRLQEFVTQTWNWVGGFVSPTDVTSTPLIIPTTDYSRYKRVVVVESANK
jgi:hypothetical protein